MKKILCLGFVLLFALYCGCGQKTDYYALLAEYSDFAREDAVDVTFTYDFGGPQLAALEAKWGLREIAGNGDTLARALNLLHWLCAHTYKVSDGQFDGEFNAAELLDFAFDSKENGLDCRYYSVAFSEMLLAVGIKAKALYCYPAVYRDNHVVVRVCLPEEARWVMLDPSFDLYVTDEAGRVLDAPELRQKLAERAALRLNEGNTYGGDYFDYMAEDMLYFECRQDAKFGMAAHEENKTIYLLPVDSSFDGSLICATWDSFWE